MDEDDFLVHINIIKSFLSNIFNNIQFHSLCLIENQPNGAYFQKSLDDANKIKESLAALKDIASKRNLSLLEDISTPNAFYNPDDIIDMNLPGSEHLDLQKIEEFQGKIEAITKKTSLIRKKFQE